MTAIGLQLVLLGGALTGTGAWLPAEAPDCRVAHAPGNVQAFRVAQGDRLVQLMRKAGAKASEAERLRIAFGRRPNLHQVSIGDRVELTTTEAGLITWFRYRKTLFEASCATRDLRGELLVAHSALSPETKLSRVHVKVETNLDRALSAAKEGPELSQMVQAILPFETSAKVDAEEAPQLTLLVERRTIEGELLDYGRVFAVRWANNATVSEAFHYVRRDGGRGYYGPDGRPHQSTQLISPVPGAVQTSGYGWRRHPIKRRRRMHKGIDYGAPHGTPVRAAAEGIVKLRRYKRQLGRTVILEHEDGLVTRYAHLSRFGAKLKVGERVGQGEVIAFVGSTGLSSGAHLHFETMVNGHHTDPAPLLSAPAPALSPEDLTELLEHVAELRSLLAATGERGDDA